MQYCQVHFSQYKLHLYQVIAFNAMFLEMSNFKEKSNIDSHDLKALVILDIVFPLKEIISVSFYTILVALILS